MIMMIVSVATGIGLQQKSEKFLLSMGISLFLIMIIISRSYLSSYFKKQDFYPKFDVVGVSHIQAIASKAGIIRTENAFEGIVFKGVGITSGTI
jgi:lipoprotein-releasing system permease protein